MNRIYATFWLSAALWIFGYGFVTGRWPFTIRGLNISAGWLCLLLAAYFFARNYAARAHRAEQESLRLHHEERLRQARQHERPAEPDPNFDFSDKPAPPPNG